MTSKSAQRLTRSEFSVLEAANDLIFASLDAFTDSLRAQSGSAQSTAKLDGTPVSAADLEVDERLAEAIHRRFPGHGILSEEHETVTPDSEWTWIIDPIDGTSNFVAGLPWWCISIALAYRGKPILGIIDAPALQRRYSALDGQGTMRNGTPIRVRPTVDWRSREFQHLPVMLSMGTARRARGAGLRLNGRIMGSVALDLASVAEGTSVASVAIRPHIWDVAAGIVIVQQAAGEVVAVDGDPWLPLRAGVDHQQLRTPTAAAANARYAHEVADALLSLP